MNIDRQNNTTKYTTNDGRRTTTDDTAARSTKSSNRHAKRPNAAFSCLYEAKQTKRDI
jgi:hypothetical protein